MSSQSFHWSVCRPRSQGSEAMTRGLVMRRGRHGIGAKGFSLATMAFLAKLRSFAFRHVLFAALLAAASPLSAPRYALADDFERLFTNAQTEGTVSVLVTGWHAVTGDEAVPQGSRGEGPVAITGDELVKKLEGVSGSVSVTRRYENFPVLAMEMDAAAMRAAKAHGSGVELWEDPILYPLLEESGPLVGAPQAWHKGYTGRGLAVAVIDDGADTRHPFLARRTVFEACFSDVCPDGTTRMIGHGSAFPVGTHGTHVAGIVLGGAIDADLAGVGPELRLIIINVANRTRRGMSGQNILAGLDVVLTLARYYPGIIGAVNMSLGAPREESGPCHSRIWNLASRLFNQVGVPVVVASGNDSGDDWSAPVSFPACIEGFVAVGAVTKSAHVATFSNSGPTLDLLAPGRDIVSSVVRGGSDGLERGFESFDGTSMAAPHVAGAMALLKQASPESSVADLLRTLKETGREIRDRRSGITAELIDVGRSIEEVRPAGAAPPLPPMPDELILEPSPAAPKEEKNDQWQSITG